MDKQEFVEKPGTPVVMDEIGRLVEEKQNEQEYLTISLSFEQNKDQLSNRPLRRPNRTRPLN